MKEYLVKNNVKTLSWPGNLPDLNPIEELWKIFGDQVMKKGPKTEHELISLLIKQWHHGGGILAEEID